jgi:hypothetical protein
MRQLQLTAHGEPSDVIELNLKRSAPPDYLASADGHAYRDPDRYARVWHERP